LDLKFLNLKYSSVTPSLKGYYCGWGLRSRNLRMNLKKMTPFDWTFVLDYVDLLYGSSKNELRVIFFVGMGQSFLSN
jgi:hypothetical protein